MIDKFEFCDGIIEIICGTMIKTEKPTTQTQNPLKFQILNLERKNFCQKGNKGLQKIPLAKNTLH